MPRARHPAHLRPNRDRYSYGSLSNGAKDTPVDRFLRWTFSPPNHIGTARQLRAGQWLPMQPDYFQGEHPLGEGGMGIVHLWCCVDENNRIRDRVIVKQVHPGVTTWERKDAWRNGEIEGEPRESMLGNEIYANLESSAPGDGKFVTQCLGYGDMRNPNAQEIRATGNIVYRNIAGYKLYIEYCPFGDLRDAIIRQKEAEEPFHEGFIWMMFEALAECAVAMDQSKIVHSDITTSNILLAKSDPEWFKIWPIPKLADFGASRYIDEAARRRLTGTGEAMHPYFTPPELTRDATNSNWAVPGLYVTNKTNVWSVGLIICCLMRMEPELPETVRTQHPPPRPVHRQLRFEILNQREVRKLQHSSADYSVDLRKLVRSCLKYDPIERPNPSQLLRAVRRTMYDHLDGFDSYGRVTKIPWNKKERLRGNLKDIWAVGTGTVIHLRP